MILNRVFCGLDTIHITITRPRSAISFMGEVGEPTDTIFYGILEILIGKGFVVQGGSKKFVNDGKVYIQSNAENVLIQLRSTHLMQNGRSKVSEIFKFLDEKGIRPKPKRNRKKDASKDSVSTFYQITRLDFTVDYETSFNLVKILNEKVGYTRFFTGIQKGYAYRVFHDDLRLRDSSRVHRIKELKIENTGFALSIYNKAIEIAEVASPEKLALYPSIYREILIDPKRYLFRVELRFFRSRSVAFNTLSVDELFELPQKELLKFGKATNLIKKKGKKKTPSTLFSRLFDFKDPFKK